MNVNFYKFAKKENSTAQPTGDGTVVACVWKTPSSIQAPVIELTSSSPPDYNYCYIASTGRYYFVTGTAYNAGVWELSLRVDVLASFKTDIGGTSMYFTRSSASQNSYIRDDLYPIQEQVSRSSNQIKAATDWSTGCIVVNVVNGSSNTGTTAYVFSVAAFGNFIDQICVSGDNQISTWDSVLQSINVEIFEPLRYITSAYWFPVTNMSSGTVVSSLRLGNFVASVTCYPVGLDSSHLTKTYTVSIPKHPNQNTRGKYLNAEPFAEYYANLGPFGSIKLDSLAMVDASSLTIDILQDPFTGQGRAIITTNNNVMLANVATQWGVPLALSSGGIVNPSGIIQAVGGTIGAVASGMAGNVAGAAIGATAALGGVASIAGGSTVTIGSNGALADFVAAWNLDAKFYNPAAEDKTNNGRPYCSTSTPATLTGYMMAQKGLVESTTASKVEIDAVNAYMEGGFYYE